jgi:hypothetical protein
VNALYDTDLLDFDDDATLLKLESLFDDDSPKAKESRDSGKPRKRRRSHGGTLH